MPDAPAITDATGARRVDADSPWLGLLPFTEETQRFFFGRDAEVREIFLRVRDHTLTVLYGQSGLGKSSLLGAGLIPKLKADGFRPALLRLRFEAGDPPLLLQVREALATACSNSEMSAEVLIERWKNATLWECFHHSALQGSQLTTSPPVLLFDQFEEIFTLGATQSARAGIDALATELANLIENRPPAAVQARLADNPEFASELEFGPSPLRVIITLREDYLSHFEAWKSAMPSLMRNRMSLHLLRGPQAWEAVFKPGNLDGRQIVTAKTAVRIVRFVANQPKGMALRKIEAVPPLLSLVCAELNERRMVVGDKQILPYQLQGEVEEILSSFYDNCFADLSMEVKELVEKRLLSPSGFRESISLNTAIGYLSEAGIARGEAERSLQSLIDKRLLVSEDRGGTRRLELTHDVLTRVAVRSRDFVREINPAKDDPSGRRLNVFISGASDVAEERDRAKSVVEELRRRYAGRLDLRVLLWEDLPLQADMSFQQGIDLILSEGGVDIAIFVLWARLGPPLGPLIRKPDGSQYRSGTELEWNLMLQARAQSGGVRPNIVVYARDDDVSFDERLRGLPLPKKEDLIEQRKLVENFIREEFQDAETKLNLRAYHRFDRPTTFAERLRIHLQELLDPVAASKVSAVWDIAKKGAPFIGLDAFQFEHAPVFFGREDEIVAVRQLLREQARRGCAFVLITGASGSGKSSLVRAGVLPAVAAYEIDRDVTGWRIAIVTPAEGEGDLLLTLARALTAESALPALRDDPDSLAQLAGDLARDPEMVCLRVLRPALESESEHQRLLVFADQLEELCTDQKRITPEAHAAFVRALEALARSGCAWVLATVRSDYYAQCQSLSALVRMKEGGGQFDLVPPGADALDRLIRQPAALAGLQFERRGDTSLADVILRDATAHRELLPLLEYLLHRLCAERTAKGVLTFASYEALNGVEGALARRADAVIAKLSPSEATLDALLAALVTVSGNEQESFVRRRVLRTELERDDASRVLVATLIDERLLTSSAQPGGPAIVTVAHEALFRVWSRALAWFKRNREFLRVRARVDERLDQWRASARETSRGALATEGDPSFLLQPGRELNDARDQLALRRRDFTQEERRFIFKSLEASEENDWRDTLAAGDEEEMPVHWHRLQAEYATMRDLVLSHLLAEGNARERRHAALLLGMVPPQELNRKLMRLVVADGDDAVRRAAAYSLMRLDEIPLCKKIATRAGKLGGESAALGALARLRVARTRRCARRVSMPGFAPCR